jgi:hypothetical protein
VGAVLTKPSAVVKAVVANHAAAPGANPHLFALYFLFAVKAVYRHNKTSYIL